MSMGLYEKYEFPHMYTSPELGAATQKLADEARKNQVILGVFLFGTTRVGEFLEKGFTFISIGNDLHHVLTQAAAYVFSTDASTRARSHGAMVRRSSSSTSLPKRSAASTHRCTSAPQLTTVTRVPSRNTLACPNGTT